MAARSPLIQAEHITPAQSKKISNIFGSILIDVEKDQKIDGLELSIDGRRSAHLGTMPQIDTK